MYWYRHKHSAKTKQNIKMVEEDISWSPSGDEHEGRNPCQPIPSLNLENDESDDTSAEERERRKQVGDHVGIQT